MHAAAPTGRDGRPPATTPMRQGHIRKEREEVPHAPTEGGDRSGASVAALPAQSDGTRHPSVSRETNPRSSARLDLQADQALLTALSLSPSLSLCTFSNCCYFTVRSTKAHASAAHHAQRRTSGACKG